MEEVEAESQQHLLQPQELQYEQQEQQQQQELQQQQQTEVEQQHLQQQQQLQQDQEQQQQQPLQGHQQLKNEQQQPQKDQQQPHESSEFRYTNGAGVPDNEVKFKQYVRNLLLNVLPRHDYKQDEFLNNVAIIVELPINADEVIFQAHVELLHKQAMLFEYLEERDKCTAVVRSYYELDPNVTMQECEENLVRVFEGKKAFVHVAKDVTDLIMFINRMLALY